MSVTEFKRRSKKAYFLMGAISMLIPMLLAVTSLTVLFYNCRQKNKMLETKLNQRNEITGYVLNKDIEAGEEITADMLYAVSMTGEKNTKIQSVDKKVLVGKFAKASFVKGTLLQSQCVYEEEEYSSDMRIHEFDFIDISNQLQNGEFVDIRIAYPNGEDYIVVNHKQIISIYALQPEQTDTGYKISMKVTEEEILRLASAYVDMSYYPGARIYAVSYLDQFQQAGMVDYPVNSQVFQLLGWNPNIMNYVSSPEEQQYRMTLEKNLSEFAVDSEVLMNSKMEQEEYTVDADSFFE